MITESKLSCPTCGYVNFERMPEDACLWFYECKHCHSIIKPKYGDCCVFCSYGSVQCPPMQRFAESLNATVVPHKKSVG